MKIEDIEVGKWYWFSIGGKGATGNAHLRMVLAKTDTVVVSGFNEEWCIGSTWKPEECLAEDKNKNTLIKKDKSWRSLWGLISR